MKFKIITFLFLIYTFTFAGEIKDKAELQIKQVLGMDTKLAFSKIAIAANIKSEIEKKSQQRFFRDEVYLWKIMQKDTLLAFAILDNVPGKSMPITFLAIFDTLGTVVAARIVKYREAIGGAISNYTWLSQFKNVSSANIDKQNIDAISGATISVNAITKGIKKLTLLFPFIQKKN